MQKTIRTIGTIIGIVAVMATVVAGVIDTRSTVGYLKENVQSMDAGVREHDGKLKVLERRTDDLDQEADHQGDVLDDIKDTLGDLRTEQKVQGQLLKGFIEEYRRKEV